MLALSAILVLKLPELLREDGLPLPPDSQVPTAAPWGLNREFLLPETTSRILFVVDVRAGRQPLAEPLDHLAAIASVYGERPASWVRLGQPGAPSVQWSEEGALNCSSDSVFDPKTAYVFIRFVGRGIDGFGLTSQLEPSSECGNRSLWEIQVAQERIADAAILWMNRRRLEEHDLVHEYGHVLRLGTNPAHAFISGGLHCVNPDCALALPRTKAVLYAIYRTGMAFRNNRDYCSECKLDIVRAKRFWRTGETFDQPVERMSADPSQWIETLPASAFRPHGVGEMVLVPYGKRAMPALMRRLADLPGGSASSPRAFASSLAQAIVMVEARKRANCVCDATITPGDQSLAMSRWWKAEGARFMTGDSWQLPPEVVVNLIDASK